MPWRSGCLSLTCVLMILTPWCVTIMPFFWLWSLAGIVIGIFGVASTPLGAVVKVVRRIAQTSKRVKNVYSSSLRLLWSEGFAAISAQANFADLKDSWCRLSLSQVSILRRLVSPKSFPFAGGFGHQGRRVTASLSVGMERCRSNYCLDPTLVPLLHFSSPCGPVQPSHKLLFWYRPQSLFYYINLVFKIPYYLLLLKIACFKFGSLLLCYSFGMLLSDSLTRSLRNRDLKQSFPTSFPSAILCSLLLKNWALNHHFWFRVSSKLKSDGIGEITLY